MMVLFKKHILFLESSQYLVVHFDRVMVVSQGLTMKKEKRCLAEIIFFSFLRLHLGRKGTLSQSNNH